MRRWLSTVAALFIAACGGGDSSTVAPAPPPPTGPDPVAAFEASIRGLDLDTFFDRSVEGLLTRSPETVVWLSLEAVYPLDGVALDDWSEAYRRDTFDMYGVALDVLQSYDRASLSAEQQLHYDVYEWYLDDVASRAEFFYFGFPATYGNFGEPGPTQRFFTDIHPLGSRADAENYISRLALVERKFTQIVDHLDRQRTQAGIVEPSLSIQVALGQFRPLAQASPSAHPYFTAFADRIDAIELSAAQRNDLRNRAQLAVQNAVIPGYRRLVDKLQELLGQAPTAIGVGQYAEGDVYYAYALQHHTSTDLTPAVIHQLGLDELARIHTEMRMRFDQLGYPQNETLEQLFARVATDGGIIAAGDALATFENLVAFAESNLAQAFDVFPAADVIVLPDPFGGFYIGPSFDGSRPGAFYAGTRFDQPYAPMPSLTFHETLPGHHLQIALAMEADVPAFRKLVRTTGFVEGWALYAERLAFELGWYDNDVFGDLGRLQYEALRAARLVIDTGIHSLGWSFEQAVQFNQDNVGATRSASEAAVARYSVWPGQATAYLVGMLQILAERERAMNALGGSFDLTAFHRALLTNGAVPLGVLPTVVDRYIADAQAAP